MPETDEAKAHAARRVSDEKRLQEVWRQGEAFDQRMEQLTRDAPRAPRADPEPRRRR